MYKLANSKHLIKLGWKYLKRGYYSSPNDIGILAAHNYLNLCGHSQHGLEILIDFIIKNKEQPKEFWVKNFRAGKIVMKDCPIWILYDNQIMPEDEFFEIYDKMTQQKKEIRKSNTLSDEEKKEECRKIHKPDFGICLKTVEIIKDLDNLKLLIKTSNQG